jgi:hypothetical protein
MGQILDTLDTLLANDQIVELRAFSRRAGTYSKIFAPDDRATMEVEAERCSGFEGGVYFTLNPLAPAMLTAARAASDGDVIRRRIMLIDVDPERPKGVSAMIRRKPTRKKG